MNKRNTSANALALLPQNHSEFARRGRNRFVWAKKHSAGVLEGRGAIFFEKWMRSSRATKPRGELSPCPGSHTRQRTRGPGRPLKLPIQSDYTIHRHQHHTQVPHLCRKQERRAHIKAPWRATGGSLEKRTPRGLLKGRGGGTNENRTKSQQVTSIIQALWLFNMSQGANKIEGELKGICDSTVLAHKFGGLVASGTRRVTSERVQQWPLGFGSHAG